MPPPDLLGLGALRFGCGTGGGSFALLRSTVLHGQLAHVAACHRGGSANVGRFDGAKMFGAVSQDIDVPAGY